MTVAEWVRRSIEAGHNPMAVYQEDGWRGLWTDWCDIDRTISPWLVYDMESRISNIETALERGRAGSYTVQRD